MRGIIHYLFLKERCQLPHLANFKPNCYYIPMSSTATLKKLPGEVKSLIAQAVIDVLNDPDFGLALTEKAKKRLRDASLSGKKMLPLSMIKRKYG